MDSAHDSSHTVAGSADRPRTRHLHLVLHLLMPYYKAMCEQEVARIKEGHIQPNWAEQHFLRSLLVRFSGNDFDDACSHIETSVIVGPDRSKWLDLRKLCNILHHFFERIVTVAK